MQTRTADWATLDPLDCPEVGMTTGFVFADSVNSVKCTAHVEKKFTSVLYSVVYMEYLQYEYKQIPQDVTM